MGQSACLSKILIASVYNNYSCYTIEIVVNTGMCHFSPDTIFIHSKDTIYWKNTCGSSNTVLSDNKTLRGNLDIGTLDSGETSRPFTDFAEGTASFYIKSHGKSYYGVIIVLPIPASANQWEIFSKEDIIENHSSVSMGDGPSETVSVPQDSPLASKKSDSKSTLQFDGSIQISGQFRHQN